MKQFWSLFYNILIVPTLFVFVRLIGIFNSKVRTGIIGRRRLFEELILNAAALDKSKKLIWFHSSSLGEFEQAKPVIEQLKKTSDINILVTFFSPSGYENSKKYPYADLVSYLPFDTKTNAEKFINIVRPDLAVIMRYDIWPNHIWSMKKIGVTSYLIDATMKPGSARKLPIVKNFHKVLFKDISKILTVSQTDSKGFESFDCSANQLMVVGDTRFDRVYQRSLLAKNRNLIKDEVLKDKKILVAGSTWGLDEDVIIPAFIKLAKYDPDILLIIAPHEPTLIHLERIENEFSRNLKTIRFSHLNNYKDERVIIIDSIGILLTLYTYADAAFIGGSFKQSIHNVLEAAVYGVPVLFGPKIENSQETQKLLKRGGGILIMDKRDAFKQLRSIFRDDNLRKEKGKISKDFVKENLGATDKILNEIYKVI